MVVIQADMGFDLPETEAFTDHTRTTEFIYDGYTKDPAALDRREQGLRRPGRPRPR